MLSQSLTEQLVAETGTDRTPCTPSSAFLAVSEIIVSVKEPLIINVPAFPKCFSVSLVS
jgi:hypothetical protein